MKIELRGIGSSTAGITKVNSAFSTFSKKVDSVVSSFKTVKNRTENVDGGIGTLQSALDHVNERLRKEEKNLEQVNKIKNKMVGFLELAKRVDDRVSSMVNKSQESFFKQYPHLKPVEPKKKKWYEAAWDWICGAATTVWNGIKSFAVKAWDFIKDTAKKAWGWLKDNWAKLLIGVAVVVAGAIVTVISAGSGAVFVGALLASLKSMAVSALISASIGAVSGAISGGLEGALKGFGSGLADGIMWGGIFAGGSQMISGIMKATKALAPGLKGLKIGKIKLWSPNSLNNPNIGGTILKFGKFSRIDVEAYQLLHIHFKIFGKTINPSYFPVDNTEYFESDDDILNWLSKYHKVDDETALRSFLGRMLFSNDEVFKKVKVLSGGEKARVMLSKMMLEDANFLIFDETTNHLDLESITSLNEGLVRCSSELLIASHDHELISTVANRIIEIFPNGKIIDRRCDYDSYLQNEEVKRIREENSK